MNENKIYPFVKWVGGKRQLLNEISKYIPPSINTYFEPFVSGGAVMFYIQNENVVINDLNSELINLYKVIKDKPLELIELLKLHKNESDYFYKIRNLDKVELEYQKLSDLEKASRIIYLNRACFNGLFRVNSLGQFNTSFGKYKQLNFNEENIINVSKYFNEINIKIISTDFEEVLKEAIKGDFVYLDPPYDLVCPTSFVGYNKLLFNRESQVRLKKVCDDLNLRGVKFLLSNAATDFIKELYKDYHIVEVKARRSINSDKDNRKAVSEVLVFNYQLNL